jgi:transposase
MIEWSFFELFVVERGPKRGRPPTGYRRVLDAVFWIAHAGSPWRDLPDELGRWASVYKQSPGWIRSGPLGIWYNKSDRTGARLC